MQSAIRLSNHRNTHTHTLTHTHRYEETDRRRCINESCLITESNDDEPSVSNPRVAVEMSRWIVASALQCILDLHGQHSRRRRRRRPGVSEILVSAVEELRHISDKTGGSMSIESHIQHTHSSVVFRRRRREREREREIEKSSIQMFFDSR